ncbi:hypothetical protein NM688_g7851 [Phlebia brevispora]|uniref:Uncharacterized protein n=1 Tax=Phlebia brevispora TaxID=194682 RepID=A0ACC1S0F7_9APHY|nr:hypothetical protein NM688_g7851 [Phlebia brevispora]
MRNKFAPFGIVHSLNNALVCLPLEQVDVHAEIVDVSATVTFTQTFWQGHSTQTKRAKYVFPIPAHAAICGFEMSTEDGRTVTAVAKETETAKQEHEQAIQEGKMTGLVVMASGDVFTVSLGCLPSLQMITTKLTYVMDLMEDDSADQIRLLLPVCIGSRYGQPPSEMAGAKVVPPERIRIAVDVFMSGEIRSITSPSHPTVAVNDDAQVQIGNVPSPRRKAAQYACQDFLTEDFVLCVKSDGLDTPRCFAERSPAGTVAMQLAVVPKLTLPNIPEQEYIFLVDRSGSMNGNRIATAKRALVLLLRALPARGTTFNVFSFGSLHDSLWEESRKYDEQSLEEATAHVDSMLANYGGTKLREALEAIFETRCVSLPTSVFVLTDGNTHDLDNTINTVSDAVKAAHTEAPLRIFTLGIGESTSTAMCEGIARVGNGLCLMSAATETILAKCSKLVKASRTVILQDVTIDWGASEGLAIVSPLQGDSLQDIGLRQGPWKLPILYTGFRCTVFALVNAEEFVLPDHVVIQARYTGTDVLKIPVAVQLLEAQSSESPKRPLIQTLAARRIIMDLEDADKAGSSPYKDAIVHLGEQYQLASRYTSFIAVEDRPSTSEDTPEERSPSPSLTSTRHTVAASVHPNHRSAWRLLPKSSFCFCF